jgi:copper chaperone CopZ
MESQNNLYFYAPEFIRNCLTLNLLKLKTSKLASPVILFVLLYFTISCSCNNSKTQSGVTEQATSKMEVVIGGMTCTGCEQTIQRNVAKLEGIKSVKASFTIGNALIDYIPGMADTTKIKSAITGSGYTVKKIIAVQTDNSSR